MDAAALARSGAAVDRTFRAAELQRLIDAGVNPESSIGVHLQFSELDGKPVVDGELSGALQITCQRCMQPMNVPLAEQFRVMIASEERADEPGGYEPVLAEAARFDLRWLAEEQALLALPLVPMHEDEHCNETGTGDAQTAASEVSQKPFANLRDLLRKS